MHYQVNSTLDKAWRLQHVLSLNNSIEHDSDVIVLCLNILVMHKQDVNLFPCLFSYIFWKFAIFKCSSGHLNNLFYSENFIFLHRLRNACFSRNAWNCETLSVCVHQLCCPYHLRLQLQWTGINLPKEKVSISDTFYYAVQGHPLTVRFMKIEFQRGKKSSANFTDFVT